MPKIAAPYPLTKAERLYHLCEGEERSHYDLTLQEGWEFLIHHRQANRQFRTPQFSASFLDALLEISRGSEREVAISYDTEKESMVFQWGEADNAGDNDAARVLTLLHTHPRATKNSLPATMHAVNDLYALIVFSRSQSSAAVSTVIGRICGGEMEVSSIAIEGAVLYTTNPQEKVWVESILALPRSKPLQEILIATKTAPLTVEVHPEKIAEIAGQQKFLEKWEKSALEFFGKPRK